MKKNFAKLFIAAMMLGTASVPTVVYGGKIKVICENNGNGNTNKENEYPHRVPAHYSHLAVAYWDAETSELSIGFNADAADVTISIYRGDALVDEANGSISVDDEISFNLSSYGTGDYQVVITGIGNDDLYGYFSK